MGKSSFEQNISAEADILVEKMKKYEGDAFDPKHLFGNAVSNVICAVVFGKRFQHDDPLFQELLTTLAASVAGWPLLEVLPILGKLRMLPFVRSYVDVILRFHDHIRRLVGQHKHEADVNNPRDLIDVFLIEKKLSEAQGVDSPALQSGNLHRLVADVWQHSNHLNQPCSSYVLRPFQIGNLPMLGLRRYRQKRIYLAITHNGCRLSAVIKPCFLSWLIVHRVSY